jgi:hypothetical protein
MPQHGRTKPTKAADQRPYQGGPTFHYLNRSGLAAAYATAAFGRTISSATTFSANAVK